VPVLSTIVIAGGIYYVLKYLVDDWFDSPTSSMLADWV